MKVIPSQRPYSYEKKQFTYGQRTLDVLWLEHKYTDASFRRAGIGFRLSYDTFQLSNKKSHSSSFSPSFIEFFRLKTQFSQHTRRNLSAPCILAVGGLLISALGIYGFIVGNFKAAEFDCFLCHRSFLNKYKINALHKLFPAFLGLVFPFLA